MITNNGGIHIARRLTTSSIEANKIRKIDGTYFNNTINIGSTYMSPYISQPDTSHSSSGVYLIIGSGNTDVSPTDYCLANAYDDSEVSSTGNVNASTGKITVTGTFINTSGGLITIRELGLCMFYRVSSTSYFSALFARVLVPERILENG